MTVALLDTNVLASGFVGQAILESTPGELLRSWRRGAFRLVISEHILTELQRTFQLPYFSQRLAEADKAEALALLLSEGLVVEPAFVVPGVATHSEDDPILAAAASARADYLVTGDKQLQLVGSYQGVSIVSPKQFLELLLGDQPTDPS